MNLFRARVAWYESRLAVGEGLLDPGGMSPTMSKLSISTIAASLCGSLLLTACPGDDTTGTGTETESASSSSTGPVITTMPPTTMTTDQTTTTVDPDTTVGPSDTTTTGTPDTTTTGETATTTSGDSTTEGSTGGSTGSTGGSTGGSTTGEPPAMEGYGDCANNDPMVACLVDEECVGDGTGNAVCLEQGCVDAGDCALPATGDSVATCMDVTGDGTNDCYLDCSMGETCPDGMVCVLDFVCIWEPLPPPPGMCPDQDLGNTVPQSVMGDNTGLGDDWNASCAPNGEDATYQFTAPAAGNYQFDTAGSPGDTVLAILDDCAGPEVDCNDDTVGLTSEVTLMMAAGQTVIIVVEGYNGEMGPFTLNISQA